MGNIPKRALHRLGDIAAVALLVLITMTVVGGFLWALLINFETEQTATEKQLRTQGYIK